MPHKLLLADDSVTIQRVIELTFADEDVDVIAVGDGQQAIQQVQSERPDIVLADVGMPERDGYEVAAFIKKSPELAHIPVLLLTGAFEPIDEARARAAGCDGVLVKPFEPQLVIARVKDLISGRAPALQSQSFAPPAAAPSSGSVDEYFDRLGSLAEELAGWNPDAAPSVIPDSPIPERVEGRAGSERPQAGVAGERVEAAVSRPLVEPLVEPRAPDPGPRLPTLAEAFSALLAAEQGRKGPQLPLPGAMIDDATVDRIAQRVVERMGDREMRSAVLEVAERLVAEEIARIKSQAR